MPELSVLLKEAFEKVSPFIEQYTSEVCPQCESVCCIDRHGCHEREDLLFLTSLGDELPDESPLHNDTEPCRFLTPAGCRLPRWKRPYRCTWYFCPTLLDALSKSRARDYRAFVELLRRILSLRERLYKSCF